MKNFQKFTITNEMTMRYYNIYGEDLLVYQKEMIAYADMAKAFMNKPFNSPLDIVGNYDWHQEFPYEQILDLENSDHNASMKIVDWGCGPGRMVERARRLYPHVDGIDISEYALRYATEHFEGSSFYVSSGIDVGNAPENSYDLVFSTIAMQHIPCRTIRKNIWRGIHNILKPGGRVAIQLAYHPTMKAGVWSPDTEHASYESDFWNAKATNGHADMIINHDAQPFLYEDVSEIFSDVRFEFANVDKLYANLNGRYHAPYWAQDWLIVHGVKS